VTALNRRFRSLLIALVVLGLSAGAVLAARPALSARSDTTANQAEGTTEPSESAEPSDSPEPSESAEPSDATNAAAAPAAPAADTSTGVHPDNHGLLVSEAAQSPTPTGFANHGAYVRTIAQANAGHAAARTHSNKVH
jgi:cytoskeletal protein RodZ